MIAIENLTKMFDNQAILSGLTANIKEGCIYGLIGSNGAGKSTLLNILDGIYRADGGTVQIDGQDVYENTVLKDKIAYVSDDPYFFNAYSMEEMARFLEKTYPSFTMEKFREIAGHFPLDVKKKMNTFSKGMKRQAAIVFALSQSPSILLCDESFDGLDPVIRQLVKRIVIGEVESRGMTAVISSHNLRELENFCDVVGILHDKKIILERSIDDIKDSVHKIQAAFKPMIDTKSLTGIDILSMTVRANVLEIVAKGNREEILARIAQFNPILVDPLELTLEDIFIYEMEVSGYDFSKILL